MSHKKSVFTVIAHRGGPDDNFVENSYDAFERAIKNGVPIETDIWLQNNELVIVHNEPTTGGDYMKLGELLDLTQGKVDLYLELKKADTAVPLFNELKKSYSNHLDTVILISFEKDALRNLREKDKNIRLGLLYREIDNEFIDLGEELGVEFVGFNWLRVFPGYFNIKQSREATELKHYAYTVNDKLLGRIMKSFGMCGLFTDYPDKF